MRRKGPAESTSGSRDAQDREQLLTPREAALILNIAYPTIKQWIYHKKLRTITTPGGHYRIPRSEVDRFLYRTRGDTETQRREMFRRLSGRNQLVGRIVELKMSGLMAQVTVAVGEQEITSIITAGAVREMQLKKGQTVAALIKATEVMILRV